MPFNFLPIPKTLEEAVERCTADLDEAELKFIKDNDANVLQLSVGMALRNNWKLWTGSVLVDHFKERFEIGHPDDIAGIVFGAVWCKVNGKEHDIDAQVRAMKLHWAHYGIDPLTAQQVTS